MARVILVMQDNEQTGRMDWNEKDFLDLVHKRNSGARMSPSELLGIRLAAYVKVASVAEDQNEIARRAKDIGIVIPK